MCEILEIWSIVLVCSGVHSSICEKSIMNVLFQPEQLLCLRIMLVVGRLITSTSFLGVGYLLVGLESVLFTH